MDQVEQIVYDDPAPAESIRCLFYPDMDCPIQEAFEKATIGDKLTVVPKDNPFGMITMLSSRMQKYMVLVAYCNLCPYKGSKDWEANINKKLQLAEKYGEERDSELQIVRVYPRQPKAGGTR